MTVLAVVNSHWHTFRVVLIFTFVGHFPKSTLLLHLYSQFRQFAIWRNSANVICRRNSEFFNVCPLFAQVTTFIRKACRTLKHTFTIISRPFLAPEVFTSRDFFKFHCMAAQIWICLNGWSLLASSWSPNSVVKLPHNFAPVPFSSIILLKCPLKKIHCSEKLVIFTKLKICNSTPLFNQLNAIRAISAQFAIYAPNSVLWGFNPKQVRLAQNSDAWRLSKHWKNISFQQLSDHEVIIAKRRKSSLKDTIISLNCSVIGKNWCGIDAIVNPSLINLQLVEVCLHLLRLDGMNWKDTQQITVRSRGQQWLHPQKIPTLTS